MSDAVINNLITTAGMIILALLSLRNGRKTDAVAKEVTTLNGKTIAVLADNQETRRIEELPKSQQTKGDREHLASEAGNVK